MERDRDRPDPDMLLARIKADTPAAGGRLRLYLGAAPGVGKTFAMLQEAHRRRERGADLVVGFVETHGRAHTAELLEGLEIVPPLAVPYKGVTVYELDVEAVLRRQPRVALVDELAHTNVEGSRHQKRYEDVEELLRAGIEVISTLNVQHIESLNDVVRQITGVTVRETVPDRMVDEADQIELIDMAPEALIRRMKHGNIYPPAQAERALAHFFTAGNLSALRDLALRATTREVEARLDRYMTADHAMAAIADRVLVAVDHQSGARGLVRRGWRLASVLKGELVVAYVEPSGARGTLTIEDERHLRTTLQLADELSAQVVRLRGKVAEELDRYANEHAVTHMIIGRGRGSYWHDWLHGSVTHRLLRAGGNYEVHIVPLKSESTAARQDH